MLAVRADVGKPEDVKRLFAETKKAFGGRLDFLFNNAGFGAPPVPMEELHLRDSGRSVVDVILTGSFLCAQEAIKIMKAQTPKGGRIVNNGSISALHAAAQLGCPTPRPSMPSPGSPSASRSTDASTTSPAASSTSATPTPPWAGA